MDEQMNILVYKKGDSLPPECPFQRVNDPREFIQSQFESIKQKIPRSLGLLIDLVKDVFVIKTDKKWYLAYQLTNDFLFLGNEPATINLIKKAPFLLPETYQLFAQIHNGACILRQEDWEQMLKE